jgi:hypothetical protein
MKKALLVSAGNDMVTSEHLEQAHLIMWFRRTYPDTLIFAIPNGGLRSKTQAMKLKVEGVVPGIPDLFVPAWKLWIEMKKVKGGKISPEQQAMIDYLQSVGYHVIVGLGAEDAKAQILENRND